jgi:SAM-dependent methyltransferase
MAVSPGAIVEHGGERRVVVDVDAPDDMPPVAVLRYPDDDPRRTLDDDGGDVFLDAGAGKGRVLLVAATHPFRRVIGVELAEDLAAVGRRTIERNRDRLRCGNVRMVTGDILDYEIPDDVSVVYLFSPFLDHVFRGFFEALTASVDRSPRPVHLLYNYPSEHVYLLSTGRVRVEDVLSSRWPPRSRKRSEVIVTYRVLTREQAEDGGALWAEIPRRLRRPRHWLGPYDPG